MTNFIFGDAVSIHADISVRNDTIIEDGVPNRGGPTKEFIVIEVVAPKELPGQERRCGFY